MRRTAKLKGQISVHIDAEARAIIERYDPAVLARGADLITNETCLRDRRGGAPPGSTEQIVAAMRSSSSFETGDKEAIDGLQNAIVDRDYAGRPRGIADPPPAS
ncbi:hypothetical protein [Sphingobium sp. EP60837]|uniref:hypothetical protein n=1 Tax=Sphingobium sp. EP60837 TaxID=1855519 RepID=UPI0007DE0262|nr:hypothetical protein [Sphingobium sp. EP60837]ANI79397.1 hypothetical protein EP837_03003 [Sphingobium sp. EP60837]